MEEILNVLPLLVLIILIWVTYVNIHFYFIIHKAKKKDDKLDCCLSTNGRYFYIGLIIVYAVALFGSIYLMITNFLNNNLDATYLILNIITIFSIVISYLFQQIIYVGYRTILIGKVTFDYRKIKRVTYPKATQLRFTYGQKTYQTSLIFIDESKLKKALQKTR